MRAWRIVGDEPLGFAIGFKPKQAENYEFDPLRCQEDDGGKFAFLLDDGSLVVSKEEKFAGRFPEPDSLLFRSQKEWLDFLEDENS